MEMDAVDQAHYEKGFREGYDNALKTLGAFRDDGHPNPDAVFPYDALAGFCRDYLGADPKNIRSITIESDCVARVTILCRDENDRIHAHPHDHKAPCEYERHVLFSKDSGRAINSAELNDVVEAELIQDDIAEVELKRTE